MAEPKQRLSRRAIDAPSLRSRGIYLLPNLFTSAALFAGFFAIVQAMMVALSFQPWQFLLPW
jgi:CDP-diacylglycerol--serine O-phosphatidyltransferase